MTLTWQEFWNRKHKIYVSPRHIEAYYEVLGRGVLNLLPAHRPFTLLDWGCGDALSARALQNSGIRTLLYDPVPNVRTRVLERFKNEPLIRVLNESEVATCPPASIDAVLVFSVLQYVPKHEFEKLIPRFRELLVPGGILLLGDIVSPKLSIWSDTLDLLDAGFRNGFLWDAFIGLVSTFFSDYRAVRQKNGFTTYSEEEILGLLRAHGFSAKRMPENIGLSEHRMLIKATK